MKYLLAVGTILFISGCNNELNSRDKERLSNLEEEVRTLKLEIQDVSQAEQEVGEPLKLYIPPPTQYERILDAKLAKYAWEKRIKLIKLKSQGADKTDVEVIFLSRSTRRVYSSQIDLSRALKPYRGYLEIELNQLIAAKPSSEMDAIKQAVLDVLIEMYS